MPKITNKKTIQELRRWDTFGVTKTCNGFVIHRGEEFNADHSFVATSIGEVQDFVEGWANAKPCKDGDEEEDG